MRAFREGISPLRAGLIAIALAVVASYFIFSQNLPFTSAYRVQAVFENSNLVAERSPVRIAGIDVGEVVTVEQYEDTNMALVTMKIGDEGRPIGADATMKVRPRLFLEGNFFIDLEPGTPGAEELEDGGMIPVGQTSMPVQLDQVLTALQADTRKSLQDAFIGFGEALDSEPTAADDADQDPDVRGLTGAQALNKSLDTAVAALRGSSIGADSLRGTAPRDLSRMIRGIAGASRGLARNESQLSELLTDFNTAMAATASRAPQLERAVELLGPTASNLRRGLASIDAALPPTRIFAREITPGVLETPATIRAAGPWLSQALPFFGPRELRALLDETTPTIQNLARTTNTSRKLTARSGRFSRCATEVLIPTGNVHVDDGEHSAGTENYKEFWHAVASQAGEAGFDGNGLFLRLSAPGGDIPITTGKTALQGQALHANVTLPPLRTSPAYPNSLPPIRRDVPCHRNPVPDVNGPASVGPADGSQPNAPSPPVPTQGVGAVLEREVARGARLVPVHTLARGGAR